MEQDRFVDKTTTLVKAQPVKFKSNNFKNGFKVEIEFNFNPYDPTQVDKLLDVDSDLRISFRAFIKMVEEDTGSKLIRE